MRPVLQLVAVVLAGLGLSYAGEVVDGILAVVNNKAIFRSQLEDALSFEALQQGKSVDQLSEEERKKELDRMIDQELIRQEMHNYPTVSPPQAEIQQQLQQLRKHVPGAETETGWQQALQRAGLTAEDVTEQVRAQLEILHFLDARLRPTVRVDRSMVTAYYREKFLPELRRSGAKDVPLGQVYSQIQEILVQEELAKTVDYWLKTLREQSDIYIGPPSIEDSPLVNHGKP
ncbi:MAG TPA: SurA N-terminal domain-containing protein [Terriglobales bacterium]|nr:SurA N-terminal domain-containing protein [Terriglobales bacterium]